MNSTPEERLFVETLRRPVSERAAFLDGACHGDPALRDPRFTNDAEIKPIRALTRSS